jgi:hypothetical protein
MKLCARAAHTAQPNHGLEDLQVGSVHGIPLFFTCHTMTDAAFPYCRGEALAQVTDLFALDGIAHRKRSLRVGASQTPCPEWTRADVLEYYQLLECSDGRPA